MNTGLDHNTISFKSQYKSDYLQTDVYNLLDLTFEIPDNFDYNSFIVTEEYIARPDLISYDVYGTTLYTDVICKLNGIANPFELNKDMVIILPTLEYITDFVHQPKSSDKETTAESNKPLAKQKTQKRKANEAVVGDNRFRVDKSSRIVIY